MEQDCWWWQRFGVWLPASTAVQMFSNNKDIEVFIIHP